MKDKSIDIFNRSWLLQWVGNYDKSIDLIKRAERELHNQGIQLSIVPSNNYEISNILEEVYYEEVIGEKQKKKRNFTRTREQLIEQQAKKIYTMSSEKNKTRIKDIQEKQDQLDPIVTDHSDNISCLFIRTDLMTYEVRVVANGKFSWKVRHTTIFDIDNATVSISSYNTHETVLNIENEAVVGIAHFSSLGFGQGVFYEQQGLKATDRGMLLTSMMKRLASQIFGYSKGNN